MTNKQQMSELKAKFQLLFPIFNRTIEPSPSRSGSILGCGWCGVGSLCSQSYHCLRWHFPSPPCSALWVTTMQCTVRNVKNSFNPIMIIVSGSDSWRVSVTARQCTVENIGVCPCHCGGGMWGRLYLSPDYFAEKPRGWHIYSFRQRLVSADL